MDWQIFIDYLNNIEDENNYNIYKASEKRIKKTFKRIFWETRK